MAGGSTAAPKTVVRPPGGRADLPALARPLLDLARDAERSPRPDAPALAAELRRRAAGFEAAAQRAGLAPEAILDARDALVALADARARSNPALDPAAWGRALRAALPGGRVAGVAELRAAAARAAAKGPAARDLARFLGHCLEAVETAKPAPARRRRWGAALAVAGFLAVLAFWAGWAEWRYRAALLEGLPDVAAATAAGEGAALPLRAAQLDVFAAAVARVERDAPQAPLGLLHRIPALDPAAAARARQAAVASALVPGPLAEALGVALATEGEAVALYDTLRAAAILEGRADWQPRFVAGWIAAREDDFPGLAALAPHVAALGGPPAGVAVADPETLAEARRFAAEGAAAERAYLELERAEATGALADWSPVAAVPGAEAVLVRRSGAPISQGVAGLYTAAGWAAARDGGAAAAAALAAAQAAALLGAETAGAAASEEAVLDILQARTLAAWRAYVGDLRVRPFTDQPGAVLITGTLGVQASPLAALIREVWRQAGGEDRGRSHPNQLRIAAEFGPAIQFVEQGRMAEISRLFASLNVALQVLDADADLAAERLMDVQSRAASIAALSQAPRLVVEIIEDVLAQTAATSEGLLGDRVTRLWQGEVGPACSAALDGRFPFNDGPDADIDAVARAIAPGGLVPRFFDRHLVGLMDMEESPWRWKPEARLSGFAAESAAFFERAAALGEAVFAGGAPDTPVTLTALAQLGAPTVAIGGAAAPVVTTGEPATLEWPGPEPARGFEIAFDGGERGGAAGPWGMLRFLDGLRLRPRDDGRRYLVDVRLEGARAYLQMDFERPVNPVAIRPLLRGLSCPPVL